VRSALRWHPDRVEDSKKKAAEVKFREVAEAYEELMARRKRSSHRRR
jgi:DnaJ-class molecular chaperone